MKDTICKNSYSEEINYLNNPLSIKKLSELLIIQSNNHAPWYLHKGIYPDVHVHIKTCT